MDKKSTWEDWVNLVLGAWVFVMPWSINHSLSNLYMSGSMWNFWIAGALIFATAALALQNIKPWEELTNLTLGLWLMASPWMFGYNTQSSLVWNSVVVGLTVSVLAGLALPIAQRRQARI